MRSWRKAARHRADPRRRLTRPATIIGSKAQLVAYLEQGSRQRDAWRIGTEHEKFPFLTDTLGPVPYDGPALDPRPARGPARRFGWIADRWRATTSSACRDPNGGGSISLEPGGQFELSGAPLETVHDTCEEVHDHLAQVREVGDELGIGFLGLGVSPMWTRAETPVMPKGRYEIMAPYMDSKGRLGRDMMFRSCTVQVNLDFGSEADMVKKLRVSLALAAGCDRAVRQFAVPRRQAERLQVFRSEVWLDTDPDRTGMLPFAFEPGFGLRALCRLCARCADVFRLSRTAAIINCAGESFRAFHGGQAAAAAGRAADPQGLGATT